MKNTKVIWSPNEINAVFGSSVKSGIKGVSIDTRTLKEGDLFFALSGDPGPRFFSSSESSRDGHDFIERALESGAAAVVSSKRLEGIENQILVPDTLEALWDLARASRARMVKPVIAVTGSNGKTTFRAWFESLVKATVEVHGSTKSLNNHWGVPLSLARMSRASEVGIFEIGTNHPGEIEVLSKLVCPDVAVLLNVAEAHIGNFKDIFALEREKLSIANGLSDGVFVLPFALASKTKATNLITFGEGGDVCVKKFSRASLRASFSIFGKVFEAELSPMAGPRVESILALLCVASSVGFELEAILENLKFLDVPIGRGNIKEIRGIKIIDDSYNANQASMSLAISSLIGMDGKKVALLGEMLELGDHSERAHQTIADRVGDNVDIVYTFGGGFRKTKFFCERVHLDSVKAFDFHQFGEYLEEGSTVLVKGSNKVFWGNNFVQRLSEAITIKI